MKLKIIFILLFAIITSISAQIDPSYIKVQGYYQSDGTYVQPHYKISPTVNNEREFSSLEKINPYVDQQRQIKTGTNTLVNTDKESSLSFVNDGVKICSESNCNKHRLVYSSGYKYKSSIYCVLHTPKCSITNCALPRIISHIGSDFIDFCEEHKYTCKAMNCYHMSRIDSSGYKSEQTSYCKIHTPRCGVPNCYSYAMVDYFGSGYQKYCNDHKYICKASSCYNTARIDGSLDKGEQTSYCNDHTPECDNPSCSNHVQVNYFGSGYQKYCRGHKYTCKEDDCYIMARVDDSGYKSEQTSYCNIHTPKCGNPICTSHAQISYFGSGYQAYCVDHKHTCKVIDCYDMARIDGFGSKKEQTAYCMQHTPVCSYQNCNSYGKRKPYGLGYMKYCHQHSVHIK